MKKTQKFEYFYDALEYSAHELFIRYNVQDEIVDIFTIGAIIFEFFMNKSILDDRVGKTVYKKNEKSFSNRYNEKNFI